MVVEGAPMTVVVGGEVEAGAEVAVVRVVPADPGTHWE